MKIQLWNYSKKHNSTARPDSVSPALELDIVLKRQTSFNNPIFILDISGVPQYTYLKWVDINQYYYIDDIVSVNNNMWELHCSIDVLATARQWILASDSFVKYSTLNFDPYLKDDRIIPTAEVTTEVVNNLLSDIHDYSSNDATNQWILTVFSKDSGLTSYMVAWNTVRYLTANLIDAGTSIIGSIIEQFNDIQGSIVDLHWCPINMDILIRAGIVAENESLIYISDWNSGTYGHVLNSFEYLITDIISKGSVASDFTYLSPYTECKLYVPLIGVIDLPLEEYQDVQNIGFRYIINLGNGNITFQLMKGGYNSATSKTIATYNGNASYTVPIAHQQINGLGAIVAGASAIAGIASGGALTIAGIAGSVASMFSAFKRSTSVQGAYNGNFASGGNRMKLMLFKHGLSEQPENMVILYGRPCCKVLTLNTLLNGYVQTSQFSLNAPFDDAIIQEVNSLMDAGVYLQ